MKAKLVVAVLALTLTLAGCSGSKSGRTPVDPGAGRGGSSGSSGAGGGAAGRAGSAGIDVGSNALTAHVENREGLAVELVTVACAGECFDVVAVARGGQPPYAFAWSDGATTDARTLCPEERTVYGVEVTDTASDDPEFPYAAQTVAAGVTAEVLSCPDAGSIDAGSDAGDVEPIDAGVGGTCAQESFTDSSCVTLQAQTDCLGMLTYELPTALEPGEQLCFELAANASLDLITTLSAGPSGSCELSDLASTSPFGYGGPYTWSTCFFSLETRIERLGLAGFADPSVVVSARYCPEC